MRRQMYRRRFPTEASAARNERIARDQFACTDLAADGAAGRTRVLKGRPRRGCAVDAVHHFAYNRDMPLVQIRDVPDATVNALRARAAEQGLTLAAYLRVQLDRLARQPTNAEIVQ